MGVAGMRSDFENRGIETLIPNSVSRGAAIYGFEQATFGSVTTTVGARWDYRDLSVESDNVLGLTAQERDWQAVTGSAGVLWRIRKPVAVVANVARGFRAPAAPDLFANGFHEGTRAYERGNPSLAVETSLNTELGLRLDGSHISAEVTGFRNAIDDYIYLRPFGTGGRAFDSLAVAQGDAVLLGAEARAAWRATSWATATVSMDWVRGDNRTAGVPLTYVPPMRAVYGVTADRNSIWMLRKPYAKIGFESHGAQRRIDPRDVSTAGYTLVSLGIGGSVFTPRGLVVADIAVKNLTGTTYRDFMSRYKEFATGPGRGITLRLSTDF